MKNTTSSKRKCSAMLAAGAGAAVWLTTQGANASVVTGNVSTLNTGNKTFVVGTGVVNVHPLPPNLIADAAIAFDSVHVWMELGGALFWNGTGFTTVWANFKLAAGGYIAALSAHVTVDGAMTNLAQTAFMPPSQSDKYFAVRYGLTPSTYGYAWINVVSTSSDAKTIVFGKWAYENSGAAIKTLADSVTTQQLKLSDGQVKLHWANANEDGVARYEVQAKDASGAWKAVDSSTPGESRYSATVAGGSTCRLVVEKVDGATQEINF